MYKSYACFHCGKCAALTTFPEILHMLSRHVHCQFKYITEHVRAFSFHAGELRAVISLPNKGEQTSVKQA